MEKINFLKVQNTNTKRRSYLAVDQNDLISDLLENKINENQLINNCLSGLIPEKARPLVWTILLNLIPLNKPNEWVFYFKKFSEFHKNKTDKFLKMKGDSNKEEEEYDYEAINRNLRLVNNENIQKSNFTNVNFNMNIKVSSMNSANINQVNNEELISNYNNKKEFVFEKFESEENKKFNAFERTEINLSAAEKFRSLDIGSGGDPNKSKSPVASLQRDFENVNKDKSITTHCDKFINDACRNNYPNPFKEEAPIFDLIPKKQKEDKFYLFYAENPNQSIASISTKDSEISEASNIIKLDVERTFQEIDLFKTTETKEMLCKTLFIWYCDNTDLGYKQGMNEILATIFYASFNINKPIFEKIPNSNDTKENKHTEFLNLIESEDFFQLSLYVIFDQILALGLKSIYNYHNLVEPKEFSYTEEKSNFEFIKAEINELLKNKDKSFINVNPIAYNNVNYSNNNNKTVSENEYNCNAILDKNDFEFVNKSNSNSDKKEKSKFFNLENISNFILNKKERAKNNINDSFKTLKDFILKRPWDFKRKKVNAQQQQKNKYKPDVEKNPPKKIDFKIFECENMDLLNLEQMLHLEQSDLRRRVNIIFFYYLKSYDPELYNHLLHKIDPYIIIFRWILCLFNREISLKYVIYIWDCILAIEFYEKNSTAFVKSFKNKPYRNVINNFNFVNFICVSIFEDMKKELLEEEESCFVLQMLMHFPNEKNVKEIVKRALKIRNFIYDKLNIKSEFVFIE